MATTTAGARTDGRAFDELTKNPQEPLGREVLPEFKGEGSTRFLIFTAVDDGEVRTWALVGHGRANSAAQARRRYRQLFPKFDGLYVAVSDRAFRPERITFETKVTTTVTEERL